MANTTSLNMGGGNISNASGTIGTRNIGGIEQRISASISRGNYRSVVKDDKRLQKFRDAVYKLVSTWTMEDKLLILSDYGDTRLLKGSRNERVVNTVLTESLIIHLDPKDLTQLYNDVMMREHKGNKDIQLLRTDANKAAQSGKRLFGRISILNFEKNYGILKNSKNVQEYLKNRAKIDSSYKVPKRLQGQYGKLRKELFDVLSRSYNIVELTGLAMSMGIDVPNGIKRNDLIKNIINKTCLYVDLIIGRSKKSNLTNAFIDSEPYNQLLSYTSYSYVTGNPSMSKGEWAAKKLEARRAKVAILERARMQTSRVKSNSRDFQNAAGFRSRNFKAAARQIGRYDAGILANASFDQLVEMSGKYGIDPTRYRNINSLKVAIYSAMGADSRRVATLTRAQQRAKNFRSVRNISDLLSAHTSYSNASILGLDNPGTSPTSPLPTTSSGLPIVRIGNKGNVLERAILSAVPVYLVGQGGAGVQKVTPIKRTGNIVKDVNVTTEGISEKDLGLLRYIMSLKSTGKESGSSRIPKTLPGLESELLRLGFSNDNLVLLRNVGKLQDISINVMYAWAYARRTNRIKLASYIQRAYRIPAGQLKKILRGVFFRRVGRGGKQLLEDIGEYGIFAGFRRKIRSIGKLIDEHKEKRKSHANPKSEADLPEKDLAFLRQIEKLEPTVLVQILSAHGISIDRLQKFKSSVSSKYKEGLMALVAKVRGFNILARYLEYVYGLDKSKTYKELTKGRNVIRRISSFLRSVKNSARFGDNTRMYAAAKQDPDLKANPDANPGQRNPIPKITLGEDGTANEKILEAVPVYLVNSMFGNIDILKEKINNIQINKDTHAPIVQADKSKHIFNSTSIMPNVTGVGSNAAANILIGDKNTKNQNKGDMLDEQIKIPKSELSKTARSVTNHLLSTQLIKPVYVVNKSYSNGEGSLHELLNAKLGDINSSLISLQAGLGGPWAVAAPTGIGIMTNPKMIAEGYVKQVTDVLNKAADMTGTEIMKSLNLLSTGGTVKMASGGNVATPITKFASGGANIITGDAAGKNIFANGAKPELVQTTGDTKVTPLNKAGTEHKAKVDRMTSNERKSALATAISSHIVKYSYNLSGDASEVSNAGEAIKVFNVKPGITDIIDINGEQTSLVKLIAGIYSQLSAVATNSGISNELLTAIAAKPTTATSGASGGGSANPFAGGFPSSLDGILGGD